jgi:hypothetical protein
MVSSPRDPDLLGAYSKLAPNPAINIVRQKKRKVHKKTIHSRAKQINKYTPAVSKV